MYINSNNNITQKIYKKKNYIKRHLTVKRDRQIIKIN